jgi:hypothetical protein
LVDPNVLLGDEDWQEGIGERQIPLYFLADLVDPAVYSTHVNQLILTNRLLNTAPTSTL